MVDHPNGDHDDGAQREVAPAVALSRSVVSRAPRALRVVESRRRSGGARAFCALDPSAVDGITAGVAWKLAPAAQLRASRAKLACWLLGASASLRARNDLISVCAAAREQLLSGNDELLYMGLTRLLSHLFPHAEGVHPTRVSRRGRASHYKDGHHVIFPDLVLPNDGRQGRILCGQLELACSAQLARASHSSLRRRCCWIDRVAAARARRTAASAGRRPLPAVAIGPWKRSVHGDCNRTSDSRCPTVVARPTRLRHGSRARSVPSQERQENSG
jgi:hypothetical protein